MAKKKAAQNTPPPSDSQNGEMSNNLRALYNHAYDETKHFRRFEWQITVWTTSLLAAIVSVTKFFTPNSNELVLFKWLLGSFACIFTVFSIILILHCHKGLTTNRILIWKLERHFHFHELKLQQPETALFPPSFLNPPNMTRGWFHLLTWILAILVISGFALDRICAW